MNNWKTRTQKRFIEVDSGWFLNVSQIVNYTLRFVILWDILASKYLCEFIRPVFLLCNSLYFIGPLEVSRAFFISVGKWCFRKHIGFVGVVESCHYGECKQIVLQILKPGISAIHILCAQTANHRNVFFFLGVENPKKIT